MAQRTDIFALGRLGLTSGEGRRLELHAALAPLDLGGERYTPSPRSSPSGSTSRARPATATRCACASRPRSTGPCMRCLEPGRARASTSTPARSTSPAAATRSCSSPYVDADDDLDLAAWARDALRARPARPDRLHARLRGPVPALRREPQRRPRARARARARPALVEAVGDPLRVGVPVPLPFPSAMAVPKQKQSHARTNQRRSQHKISAPALNECPQCHQPRRPHRVCPQLRLLQRVARWSRVQHDEHDHDH